MSESEGEDLVGVGETFQENEIPGVEDEEPSEQTPANNEDGGEDEANKQPVKPKRIIRNPQPRLNAETLKGKRGLTALPSYFDRVRFKGKGHEEQDLNVILKTYEYWCHRLFPKYPFDECLTKIENLGNKKAVVTHIKRIRTDLVCDDEPIINDNDDSDAEQIPNSLFDDLLPASNEQPTRQLSNTQISSIEPPPGITEEQIERMRINRERAERIRREKLQQKMEMAQSSSRETSAQENKDFTFEENSDGALIDHSETSQVRDDPDKDKERNETDAGTQMDSSQLCKNLDQNEGHLVSQGLDTSNQEQITPSSSVEVEDLHGTQRWNKISSIIDSDEDF